MESDQPLRSLSEVSESPTMTPSLEVKAESSTPSQPASGKTGILERAEKLHKEITDTENRIAEHRRKIEELLTKKILSGETIAGSVQKTSEEIKTEEAKKMADEIVSAFGKGKG